MQKQKTVSVYTYQGKCRQRSHSLSFARAGTCSPLSAPCLRVTTVTNRQMERIIRRQKDKWPYASSSGRLCHFSPPSLTRKHYRMSSCTTQLKLTYLLDFLRVLWWGKVSSSASAAHMMTCHSQTHWTGHVFVWECSLSRDSSSANSCLASRNTQLDL